MRINSRMYIPVPFPPPEDDYTVLIGDWYRVGFGKLEKRLNKGRSLGRPAGVLINGKPGKHNPKASAGLEETEFVMKPEMTYRFRICNVGVKNTLNFRIQGHTMNLVEIDGSHVVENDYESLDVHVGQCYSVLVKGDKKPGNYYMVASTRFTKYYLYATAILKYTNADKKALPSPTLPPTPKGWLWSRNQWDSFRWNLTASAARPNPQGSYHYGTINITRTIVLRNTVEKVNGKTRTALNGKSFTFPNDSTPLKLSEYYGIADKEFKYNAIPDKPLPKSAKIPVTIEPIVVNVTFRDFVEIILENPEKSLQSYHLNGYSFFPVGMGCGKWSPEKRKGYNNLDAVSRHTIQVYQGSWTAILVTFDNCGMWNMRSDILERSYLGQELYFSVLSDARSLRDEYSLPERVEKNLCGKVVGLPTPPPYT
ncbi:laccase 16 [Zostera marina]|uniref:Laccase 16 n=1 Tax=Zostera marina TaxID=29655 RepID=A0A0K9NM93_ZOSMR|nr:laccase 16 [Zostera marina]